MMLACIHVASKSLKEHGCNVGMSWYNIRHSIKDKCGAIYRNILKHEGIKASSISNNVNAFSDSVKNSVSAYESSWINKTTPYIIYTYPSFDLEVSFKTEDIRVKDIPTDRETIDDLLVATWVQPWYSGPAQKHLMLSWLLGFQNRLLGVSDLHGR